MNAIAQLGEDGLAGLPFFFGTILLGYIGSLWLRQNMHLYNRVWMFSSIAAIPTIFVSHEISHWISRIDGIFWIMLLLATIPPSSGKRRRQLVESLKKFTRRWSVGIPISA
ncbi:hypothetical protein [uncultured Deinococcus sp.]|uniref:hypothetical protein n=1 Tax=uncultured Deinococcus sp. TaxID=158789 RepID=UPI00258FAD69|nr:hypothetical protein [uncultured Deinococcus sp.]